MQRRPFSAGQPRRALGQFSRCSETLRPETLECRFEKLPRAYNTYHEDRERKNQSN